jgi:predicted porin
VKLFGEVSKAKNKIDYEVEPFLGGRRDIDLTGYLLGVTVPVGAGLIRASYSHVKYDYNLPFDPLAVNNNDPKANKLAIGYVHNLSKRTALYATIARVSNKNGAALLDRWWPVVLQRCGWHDLHPRRARPATTSVSVTLSNLTLA